MRQKIATNNALIFQLMYEEKTVRSITERYNDWARYNSQKQIDHMTMEKRIKELSV